MEGVKFTMQINYTDLYDELQKWLLDQMPYSTKEITSSIKDFFANRFSDFTVLPNESSSEYLLDILVTNFTPLRVIGSNRKSLNLTLDSIEIYLAVESELGGAGASSAYGVHKNIVEDYVKLLLVKAEYKIMIFTSLGYKIEANHVINRVENLREIYFRVSSDGTGVLLVHLPGSQPKSTQVQAAVKDMSGYIISGDGEHVDQIAI